MKYDDYENYDRDELIATIGSLEDECDDLNSEKQDVLYRSRKVLRSKQLIHALPSCTPYYPVNPWDCASCAVMKELQNVDYE